jgi:hypothetical protein
MQSTCRSHRSDGLKASVKASPYLHQHQIGFAVNCTPVSLLSLARKKAWKHSHHGSPPPSYKLRHPMITRVASNHQQIEINLQTKNKNNPPCTLVLGAMERDSKPSLSRCGLNPSPSRSTAPQLPVPKTEIPIFYGELPVWRHPLHGR